MLAEDACQIPGSLPRFRLLDMPLHIVFTTAHVTEIPGAGLSQQEKIARTSIFDSGAMPSARVNGVSKLPGECPAFGGPAPCSTPANEITAIMHRLQTAFRL